MSFQQDYEFGTMCEDKVLDILNKHFGVDGEIRKSEGRYCSYDFISKHKCYELKSRTNEYDKYPTTMLGLDKCCRDNLTFLFNFTDGLYYINYDEELFATFEKKKFKRKDRIDKRDVEKNYLFIPIQHLTKLE